MEHQFRIELFITALFITLGVLAIIKVGFGGIKETKVYVQNALKRVVPLQHKLFIDKKNIFIVKEKNKIYKEKIDQAFNILENSSNGYNKKEKYHLRESENEFFKALSKHNK